MVVEHPFHIVSDGDRDRHSGDRPRGPRPEWRDRSRDDRPQGPRPPVPPKSDGGDGESQADRDRRGRDWRPGGQHKDPRDRFTVPRDVKRARFKAKARLDRTTPRPPRKKKDEE